MIEKMISFLVLLCHLLGISSLYGVGAEKNSSYVLSSLSMTTKAIRRMKIYTALSDSNIQLAANQWVTNNTAA